MLLDSGTIQLNLAVGLLLVVVVTVVITSKVDADETPRLTFEQFFQQTSNAPTFFSLAFLFP